MLESETKTVWGNKTLQIFDSAKTEIWNSYTCIVGTRHDLLVTDDIYIDSAKGNIDLITEGQFEIFDQLSDPPVITAAGYNNIGTKGNIKLTSTFGNIGLQTIENKTWADFEQKQVVIPWNPSYLKYVGLISKLMPGFNVDSITEPITLPTDMPGLLEWLTKMVMFDGFPTFLPCHMIMQNPNIDTPGDDWLDHFRSIETDWMNLTNEKYWKLISRSIGNIDIRSWSGNINIKTEGTLGNAGNINISANNKYGSLPGYSAGNINQTTNTPFRIFTDPRDLFLDSHLESKIAGQFIWFSTAAETIEGPPPIIIKPMESVQALLSMVGMPGGFGFAAEDSKGGGCINCITDCITQAAVDLKVFNILPWKLTKKIFADKPAHHTFNAIRGSLPHSNIIGGATSIFEQESNGYGHAVDKHGLDQTYGRN